MIGAGGDARGLAAEANGQSRKEGWPAARQWQTGQVRSVKSQGAQCSRRGGGAWPSAPGATSAHACSRLTHRVCLTNACFLGQFLPRPRCTCISVDHTAASRPTSPLAWAAGRRLAAAVAAAGFERGAQIRLTAWRAQAAATPSAWPLNPPAVVTAADACLQPNRQGCQAGLPGAGSARQMRGSRCQDASNRSLGQAATSSCACARDAAVITRLGNGGQVRQFAQSHAAPRLAVPAAALQPQRQSGVPARLPQVERGGSSVRSAPARPDDMRTGSKGVVAGRQGALLSTTQTHGWACLELRQLCQRPQDGISHSRPPRLQGSQRSRHCRQGRQAARGQSLMGSQAPRGQRH